MKKQKKDGGSSFKSMYVFLIPVFVAGITFLCLSAFIPKKTDNNEDDKLSTAVNNDSPKSSTESKNNETEESGENPDKTPKQYEDENKDTSSINASITKNEVVGGKYLLRVTIYEILNSGSCKLHMETSHGDSLDRSADIISVGADSSSCEGFDIPVEGISNGVYNFTVSLSSGDKTGSVKGTIRI